ncbi:hypothetical protein BS50DRAFT_501331 [Corynespora cassiicola Philippines]|uniref:RBR-type E3 ubiquitin transferase n=1 Tax=Corynespora cassiicola Philippines TaxID=1448308 RepID=A0A2T2NCL5_CORCC|nr:hypothetical protein BS50DRAFT_501331 [Corynespora cassiicola Philippines]
MRVRRTSQPHEPQSQTDRNTLSSKAHSRKGKSGISVSVKTLAPTQECLICVESRPVSRFPSRPPTLQCSHPPQVCRPCLRKWIRSEFKSRVWDQLNCPECSSKMQHDDVKEFASSEVFRKYDALSTKVALEAIPGFRWCIAKGCKSGQVHEGELTPKFKCVACKASHCAIHGVKWHKGETCAEYDYRTDGKQKKAEDAASKKLIQETAKKCPGCAWNIEKNNGCDHMTCRRSKCKHEFCWVCLAPYGPIRKQGNQMHRPKCEYYYPGED